MPALLSAFVPIWLLTAAGWAAARSGVLGEQAEAVLGRFVFHIAMPASLLAMLARTPLRDLADPSLLGFAAGTVIVFLLGKSASRRLFGRDPADQALGGMAAGYVNSANLGIPIATQVLGSASFVVTVVLFQVLTVTPVILALLDRGTRRSDRSPLRDLLLLPLRNPIVLASAAGAALSGLHWQLPTALSGSCTLLGQAAVPTALVTLGMSLHGRGERAAVPDVSDAPDATATAAAAATADAAADARALAARELALTLALKNLVQPALGYLLGRWVLHLSPHQLFAVVLCSALPTAQNVFVFAREYGRPTALPRNAVVASTVLSLATLSLIGYLLGPAG
ncbi:AEC family transporter [Streptacidiphilus cavernicola]|uniref:AEC family transporter n=1 Tax=Streptacidiphilus cavernicola TaxID=3342716 RepID=A0ABV6VYY6_9ACTN